MECGDGYASWAELARLLCSGRCHVCDWRGRWRSGPTHLASEQHDALDETDKDVLTRVMGGLDGPKMQGVAEAYDRKYQQPLWSAVRETIGADVRLVACVDV